MSSIKRHLGFGAPLLLLVILACEDSEISLEPEGPQGPPTLSGDVQPIFDNSCAFNGCHGGTILEPPEKPMSLAPGQVRGNTVNVAAFQLPGMDRIEPGRPDESYLVHKVQGTHLDVGGSGERMPLGLPALGQSEIDVIREWIADGAQDN